MQRWPANLADRPFRRVLDRLDALPIRPATARTLHDALGSAPAPLQGGDLDDDPGVALLLARASGRAPRLADPVDPLIDLPWWSGTPTSPDGQDARQCLWRHALAVALAARRIARAAPEGKVDPDRAFRAGLLHPLGLWALAAMDSDRLADWIRADRAGRRDRSDAWFGGDLTTLGRRLAERWGVEPLVRDAILLHADAPGSLHSCAHDPAGLLVIQRAFALARQTPWSLDPDPRRDVGPPDPAVRALTAEVQARTSHPLVAPDATPREEALTRSHAQTHRDLARVTLERDASRALVVGLAAAPGVDSPDAWAERAADAWMRVPGVRRAQVSLGGLEAPPALAPNPADPPTTTLPLGDPARPVARLALWGAESAGGSVVAATGLSVALLRAWGTWGALVADRDGLADRLDALLGEHRTGRDRAEAHEGQARLAALAEFAAGAGHELNNPLAVIMGRAQLLLARATDPEGVRSLRAIIAQAQRAHRILRDLMFVARPAEFRPRACQPDEVVRASLRDLRDEAEAQGVALVADLHGPLGPIWVDPEPLRQVADALVRNALEASSTGATVRFSTSADAHEVRWVVHDSGRGISPVEGPHLFDPFFCGRAAGRGLGLGLPRVARIVDLLGGDLRWRSDRERGTTFRVRWPAEPIPAPVAVPGPAEADQAERA